MHSQNTHPDRRWFSPAGLAEARAAATSVHEHANLLSDAEARASTVFTPEALKAPVSDLQDRFTNLHRGLRKLSGNYRSDKRLVAGLLTAATDVKNGISHLSDAIAWRKHRAFGNLASSRGEMFGAHWAGRETDFEAANASFNVVEEVLTLTGNNVPAALVTYMSGTTSNEAHQTIADTARADLDAWKRSLAPAPARAGRPELLLGLVVSAIDWLTTHVEPMHQAAARISTVENVTGRSHTLAEANALISLAARAKQADLDMKATESTFRATIGDFFEIRGDGPRHSR